ncbi:MAG: UbiA family prenyltransferase [Janthinobacterium lividum]
MHGGENRSKLVLGLVSTCLVASANYVINEYLDAEFDKFHPLKQKRTSVVRVVNPVLVYAEWFGLAVVGFFLAYQISMQFLLMSMLLLFMGVMYNVRPFRTKERVYLDVLSESVNNPIRFALGWFIVAPALSISAFDGVALFNSLPPSSIMVAYWMGGAFLMATKRFAEYRLINNPELAGLYRRSFRYYTEHSLLISMFFYALTAAFFLGIFLVKNRIEMLISFPFFALLFAWYLRIGLLDNSPVQGSEKLYTRKWFMLYVVLFCGLLVTLMFVKIPILSSLLEDHYNLNRF